MNDFGQPGGADDEFAAVHRALADVVSLLVARQPASCAIMPQTPSLLRSCD
jgi:hypothetical protein